MRKQTKCDLALAVFGAALLAAAWLLGEGIPRPFDRMLAGAGAGLLAFGMSMFRSRRLEEKNPERMRQARIEARDERNVALREKAAARAGNALQWAVMAAALISIGLDAPLWTQLALMGAFLLKTVLELALLVKYQREM